MNSVFGRIRKIIAWKLIKIDTYCHRCKSSAGSYSNIREGSPERGVKRQWGCRERQISAFSLAIFSDTLEVRPALLYGDLQSVIGFSVITKCVTLNDLDWLFRAKFCFYADLAGWHRAIWKIIAWKLIKIHILSSVRIFGRESSFWRYKVCADIRSGSLERRR